MSRDQSATGRARANGLPVELSSWVVSDGSSTKTCPKFDPSESSGAGASAAEAFDPVIPKYTRLLIVNGSHRITHPPWVWVFARRVTPAGIVTHRHFTTPLDCLHTTHTSVAFIATL